MATLNCLRVCVLKNVRLSACSSQLSLKMGANIMGEKNKFFYMSHKMFCGMAKEEYQDGENTNKDSIEIEEKEDMESLTNDESKEDKTENESETTQHNKLEISGNFQYNEFIENEFNKYNSFLSNMNNETIIECLERLNLPTNERMKGRQIEFYVSALSLRPNDRYNDEYHNIMCLISELFDVCESIVENGISNENETDMRHFMNEIFDIESKCLQYIDLHFTNLRYSPKEYLKRFIKSRQTEINTMAIKKIVYHKYPKWTIHDNWAFNELHKGAKLQENVAP